MMKLRARLEMLVESWKRLADHKEDLDERDIPRTLEPDNCVYRNCAVELEQELERGLQGD